MDVSVRVSETSDHYRNKSILMPDPCPPMINSSKAPFLPIATWRPRLSGIDIR